MFRDEFDSRMLHQFMNISFNIADDIGAEFVSAVRLQVNRPDLSDSRIINKFLKRVITDTVNDYRRHLALATEESELATLTAQQISNMQILDAAKISLEQKKTEI